MTAVEDLPVRLTREGPVAVLTLCRPDRRNPLGLEGDGDVFAAICREINDDPTVRCAILTGDGAAFSAGGDIKAMQARTDGFAGSAADIRESYRRNIHRMLRALHGLDVPLIAAINGPAIGLGCDLTCLADIRLASDTARFGVTFLKLGLIPGDGGAWLLSRTIGASRAATLFFTGDLIDAEEALAAGLVSKVVPAETLQHEARDLALRIAAQPGQALRMTKTLLRQAGSASYDQLLELSAAAQGLMHHTADHHEGVSALLQKRAPDFPGHKRS